ncbi:MAG: T9SS type A sorting domain-containing protein [Fimbriimonadaceae bacterium]|nr:T9SS type A sorting domain-containing protein [Chitinophagales bacterium]
MKQFYFSLIFTVVAANAFAQYPIVSIYDIQYKDDASLGLEDDLSAYDGDTVRVQGLVIFDPCTYALSTSGSRVGTFMVEESATGEWTGLHVLIDPSASGYAGTLEELNDASLFVDNFQVGNVVECTGIVSTFDGNTQLWLLPVSSEIIGFATPPLATIVNVSDFMASDGAGGQVLQTLTGEPYESVYVELQNVFVTDVSYTASSGRWTWYLQDLDGNKIRIRDVSGHFRNDTGSDDECAIWSGGSTDETATPDEYTAPTAGTYLSYVRGQIVEAFTETEYALAPLVLSDVGPSLATPPTVTNITRNPIVATSIEEVTISANIIDLDGTVASANIYYSYGIGSVDWNLSSMTNTSGDIWEGIISAPGFDGTYVNYYIEATDNEGNSIESPASSSPKTYIVLDDGITSISQIQYTPFDNGNSIFNNDSIISDLDITAIVTASKQLYDLNLLTLQDSDEPWSGIFVISVPGDGTENLLRGDEIHLTAAKVIENFGQTSIRDIVYSKTSDKNPLPSFITGLVPTDIDAKVFDASEPYEGMLVKFETVYETMDNADPAATDPIYGFGEWRLNTSYTPDEGLRVDDNSYTVFFEFGVDSINEGDELDYVQGILSYSFSNYKLEPRDMNDIAGFSTIYPNNITAFNISSLGINGSVNEAAGTISLIVPIGTDVSALVPTITFTGQYIEPATGIAQDFTSPVTYTSYSPVTYEAKEYIVAVEFVESINSIPGLTGLEVYPNPVADKVAVEFDADGGKDMTFALQDISGRNLLNFNYVTYSGKNILPIDLREFANGLYLLQIRSSDKMTTLKILVSK